MFVVVLACVILRNKQEENTILLTHILATKIHYTIRCNVHSVHDGINAAFQNIRAFNNNILINYTLQTLNAIFNISSLTSFQNFSFLNKIVVISKSILID